MKSREELDQIARDLVDEYFNSETQSLGWLQAQIVRAISRVQDEALKQVKVSPQDAFQMGRQEGIVEALNSVLPSKDDLLKASLTEIVKFEPETKKQLEIAANAFILGATWLRANMKSAPQAIICTTRGYGKHQTLINELKEAGIIAVEIKPAQPRLSDEELETLALKHVEEKDWIHNENRRALGDAIMTGYRACEERLLGIKK